MNRIKAGSSCKSLNPENPDSDNMKAITKNLSEWSIKSLINTTLEKFKRVYLIEFGSFI